MMSLQMGLGVCPSPVLVMIARCAIVARGHRALRRHHRRRGLVPWELVLGKAATQMSWRRAHGGRDWSRMAGHELVLGVGVGVVYRGRSGPEVVRAPALEAAAWGFAGIFMARHILPRGCESIGKLGSAVFCAVDPVGDPALGGEVSFIGFWGIIVFCHDENGQETKSRDDKGGLTESELLRIRGGLSTNDAFIGEHRQSVAKAAI